MTEKQPVPRHEPIGEPDPEKVAILVGRVLDFLDRQGVAVETEGRHGVSRAHWRRPPTEQKIPRA